MRSDRSEYNANRQWGSTPVRRAPPPPPRPRRRAWWKWIAAAFVIYMLVAWVGKAEREEMQLQARQYCEMVHLWNTSGGDRGWPDYAGTFASQCTPAGAVRPGAVP